MRDIKFRAWDSEEKTLVWPEFTSAGGYVIIESSNCDSTLMQYTGLNDENGVEIYEGDLLSFRIVQSSGIAEVEWFDDGWCLNLNDLVVASAWIPYLGELNYMEVVGNIHENPELLEKSE